MTFATRRASTLSSALVASLGAFSAHAETLHLDLPVSGKLPYGGSLYCPNLDAAAADRVRAHQASLVKGEVDAEKAVGGMLTDGKGCVALLNLPPLTVLDCTAGKNLPGSPEQAMCDKAR